MSETQLSDLSALQPTLDAWAPQGRSGLLPVLIEAQSLYNHISEPAAREISRRLHVPLADLYGVVDFYAMLYREPTAQTIIRVCGDPPCSLFGADGVLGAICQHLQVEPSQPTADGRLMVERVPCLGLCEHAPAVHVGRTMVAPASAEAVASLLEGAGPEPYGVIGGDIRLLTKRCGVVDPRSLSDFLARGGMAGFRKALGMPPAEVIAQVKASGLVGRGGAAFPAGVKWEGAARAAGQPKYVVCNADESEPGTFKDRVLMEGDPFSVIEGMLICGYAIGSSKGYVYIRGEYPRAQEILQDAIWGCRAGGWLGENIQGSGFSFDVELRSGAGAYICGEETALFESIEGKRGFPRVKPPFPTTHGLFMKPTSINNVETLCNAPLILEMGVEEYRKLGTEKSPGPKLFCVSGDVARPGVYEVPFGVTIRHLVHDLAGGVAAGRGLQTILFGGAAGAFATPEQLDVKMSFEDLREAGLPLGSGVVMVFDETRDLRDALYRLARFFAHESCGKCYPCQIGTERQMEILEQVRLGQASPEYATVLSDVGWTMTDASLCGLGQTAATAVLSAMKLWPEMFANGVSSEG